MTFLNELPVFGRTTPRCLERARFPILHTFLVKRVEGFPGDEKLYAKRLRPCRCSGFCRDIQVAWGLSAAFNLDQAGIKRRSTTDIRKRL